MARRILKGVGVSPGIALGSLVLLPESRIAERRNIEATEVEAELGALDVASEKVCADLRDALEKLPGEMTEYRELLEAQKELAKDPRMLTGAKARIRHKKICAAWAVADTVAELAELFHGMADPYVSDRAQDIRAMGKCLINALQETGQRTQSAQTGILAAWDISPATFLEFRTEKLTGLLTVDGGVTSHTAILARALKIPAIIDLPTLAQDARQGEMVIVDGFSGRALLGPDEREIARYTAMGRRHATFEKEARLAAHRPAVTAAGTTVEVLANLENTSEVGAFHVSGAEGVGLYRTEFAYLGAGLPTEESLYEEYCTLLEGMPGKKVTFRILDVGADKILPAASALHEPNPALGLRGIRFCLRHQEIMMPQLKALLRAAQGRNCSILIPMVTTVAEVRAVKELLAQLVNQFNQDPSNHFIAPSIGVMVETPAAVLICAELARECDFISIGTNDLLHYLMAIDRCNRHVSYLHEPFHPAFLRAIKLVIDATHAYGKKVSVCGELAADPLGVALLLGLGVDTLSATPHFVPLLKQLIRQLDMDACRHIAADAQLGTPAETTRVRLNEVVGKSVGEDFLFNSVAKP